MEASKAISRTSLGDNDELGAEVKDVDEVDKFCDLTAIYENQVFVILEKAGSSTERWKWLSPLRGGKSSPKRTMPKVRVGSGTVLIDQRR